MIKEHKNKILLTLVLILTLSFSAVAGLLVSKPKASKPPVLSVAGQQSVKEVEQPKVVESNPLTVIRSNTKGSPKLKAQDSGYIQEGGYVDWYTDNGNGQFGSEDGNGSEELSIGSIQGGSIFYVIKDANGVYGVEIVADGAYKGSGTKYFTIPHNGYRVTGFSFYCKDESGKYKDGKIFNDTEDDGYVGTTEDIDPEYEATILIRAIVQEVEYTMNLYYSLDGKEYRPVEQTFKVKTETLLASSLPENVDVNTYGRTFLGNWLVPVGSVTTSGTNIVYVETGREIKFSYKDGEDYKLPSKTQNNQFYIVNSVTGYCENNETTYEFGEKTDGKMTNPLVRAQWSYVFNARIKTPYKTDSAGNDVATAYSELGSVDTTTDQGFALADIKISSNGSYATTFVTNTGNAFVSVSDDSKKYSVINKGYEIANWKVYFSVGNTASTYLGYQSGWGTSSDSYVDLQSIRDGADLTNLSEYLDSYFVGGYDNSISIILEAQWLPVQIKVNLNDGRNIAETKFDDNYSISDNVSVAEGKTVYYYKTTTNNNKIVAKNSDASKSIKWNYYTIGNSEFVYNSTGECYDLEVEPVYVDNIYRLKLDNANNYLGYDIDNDGYKDYELIYKNSFGGYSFVQNSSIAIRDEIFNHLRTKNHFSIFDKSIGDITISEFEEYEDGSYTFVDDYVSHLESWKNSYNTAIAGTSALLKTVWVAENVGTIDGTKLMASSANVGNFYIFLANNQVYGDLPVFNVPSKDIIAWDNSLEVTPAVSYAYKTSAYNDTEHLNALNDYTTRSGEEVWMYSDMKPNYGTSYNKTLKPVLFRKNYLLDINTLKSDEGMYGYVYVNITDPTEDGKEGEFIILYNDGGMKIYSATSLQEILDVNGYIGTARFYGDDDAERAENGGLYYNPDKSNPMLKLYAGCELIIKASSVDYLVAAYANMIGYRLASIETSSSYSGSPVDPLFEGITASGNVIEKTLIDDEMSVKNYKSGTVIQVNANYEAIKYDLDIRLVVPNGSTAQYAGTIVCGTNVSGTNSGMLVLSGITVDDIKENGPMLIEYLARAGYTLKQDTLKQDAFIFSNKYGNAIPLQGYDISDDTKNSQEYVLEFNGLWLLNNHYRENGDYVVDYTNNEQLNTLKINVETYSFNYEVTVVDANGNVINSELKDGYSLCLNEESGEENIALITVPGEADKIETICSELVGKEFTLVEAENGIKFYVYKKDGQNYAIISSRLSQIADSRNYNIDYDFLLKEGMLNRNGNPLTQERLDYIFGTGDIVAVADRVLKMEIKVSELYTITMDVKPSVNSDPNDTERTTTLKNHKNIHDKYTNEGSIIAGAGYTFDNKTVVYTYAGVENKLESTFDDKRYKGVTYVLGESSSALTSNFFTLDSTMVTNGNINLYITYEPKPIEVYDINYQLNGITNYSSIVGTLINVIETPQSLEAYFGETAQTKFELLKEEYFAEVSVNGVMVGIYSYGSIATIISEVDARALDAQGFYVIINVQDVPKNVVRFKYALQDTTKAILDEEDGIIDDYGSFDVIISGQVASGVKNASGWYEYTVLDKKKVELDISDLAIGYHLSKVVLGGSEFAATFNNNKCVISESYTAGQFSNPSFTIYINKDTVKATLTAEGNYKEKYTMSMGDIASAYSSSGNTATRTLNAYIGKTLTFAEVSEETEDLNHYYYIDKNENECIIVNNSLTLTEGVISSLPKNGNTWNLQIGVKRNFKYKLDVKLKGVIDNDATVSIKYIDGTDYEGEYVYEDTELFVDVLTADYVAGNAKYDIKLSGCINKTVETGIFNKDVDNDAVIVMSGNKTLTVEVSPKVFGFKGYDSWIYENLAQLEARIPVETVENIGNFTIINNLTYKGTVVVRLDTRTSNEELYSIKLTGNDTETIVLTLNETSIVSVLVGTKEYVTAKSNAKHLAEDSEDLVVVANLISKLSEYGYNYSVITDSVDKVQISFVVKNAVKIDAEFVEYKHITQIPNA